MEQEKEREREFPRVEEEAVVIQEDQAGVLVFDNYILSTTR